MSGIKNKVTWIDIKIITSIIIIFLLVYFFTSNYFDSDLSGDPSKHYFVINGKPIALFGVNFQAGLQNKNFDHKGFIDELASNGINYYALWMVFPARQFKNGSELDRARWGEDYPIPALTPWERTGPGLAWDQFPKYNLMEWNSAFWEKLKDTIEYAKENGIIVQLTIFDENYLENIENPSRSRFHPFTDKNSIRGPIPWNAYDYRRYFYNLSDKKIIYIERLYVDKLLNETCNYTNVIYEITNEGSSTADEWNDFWIDHIRSKCPKSILLENDDFTPGDGFSRADGVTFHRHYDSKEDSDLLIKNYYKNKPMIISESGPAYDGPILSKDLPLSKIRNSFWVAFLSGGQYALQDDSVYEFGSNTTKYRGGYEMRKQIGILNQFVNSIQFWEMKPLRSFATSTFEVYSAGNPGKEYIVYIIGSGTGTLKLDLPEGDYLAMWIDPTTGYSTEPVLLVGYREKTRLETPKINEDLVLRIYKN